MRRSTAIATIDYVVGLATRADVARTLITHTVRLEAMYACLADPLGEELHLDTLTSPP